jgi:hypothetical protein
MMVILSGRERSLNEYRALLERAGLRLEKNSPTSTALSVRKLKKSCEASAQSGDGVISSLQPLNAIKLPDCSFQEGATSNPRGRKPPTCCTKCQDGN